MTLVTRLAALSGLLLATTVATAGSHGMKTSQNIVATAAATGQFETLIAAAEAAGLAGALSGDGPLTVFAPTDTAFNTLPAGTVETLLQPGNKAQLARILKFHVVPGRIQSDSLADGVAVKTLAGANAVVSAAEKGFTIEGARILKTDIDASNGVVHVIDRVIMPPQKMSRSDAVTAIDNAIMAGVPQFNHGNAAATVDIYSAAASQLIGSARLTTDERERLQDGMINSEAMHSHRDSAWALRYALDDVRQSLAHRRMMTRNEQ